MKNTSPSQQSLPGKRRSRNTSFAFDSWIALFLSLSLSPPFFMGSCKRLQFRRGLSQKIATFSLTPTRPLLLRHFFSHREEKIKAPFLGGTCLLCTRQTPGPHCHCPTRELREGRLPSSFPLSPAPPGGEGVVKSAPAFSLLACVRYKKVCVCRTHTFSPQIFHTEK